MKSKLVRKILADYHLKKDFKEIKELKVNALLLFALIVIWVALEIVKYL